MINMPNRQIGYSQEAILLQQVLVRIKKLSKVLGSLTTTTTTTAP